MLNTNVITSSQEFIVSKFSNTPTVILGSAYTKLLAGTYYDMFCYVFLLSLCMCLCLKWLLSIISYSSFKTCSNILFYVMSNLAIPDLPLSLVSLSVFCARVEFSLYASYFIWCQSHNNSFTLLSLYLAMSFWRQETYLFTFVFLMPRPVLGIF